MAISDEYVSISPVKRHEAGIVVHKAAANLAAGKAPVAHHSATRVERASTAVALACRTAPLPPPSWP